MSSILLTANNIKQEIMKSSNLSKKLRLKKDELSILADFIENEGYDTLSFDECKSIMNTCYASIHKKYKNNLFNALLRNSHFLSFIASGNSLRGTHIFYWIQAGVNEETFQLLLSHIQLKGLELDPLMGNPARAKCSGDFYWKYLERYHPTAPIYKTWAIGEKGKKEDYIQKSVKANH